MTVVNISDYRKCECDCDCNDKASKTILLGEPYTNKKLTPVCKDCFDGIDAEKHITCIECDEIRIDENGELDGRVQAGMKCGVCAYENS